MFLHLTAIYLKHKIPTITDKIFTSKYIWIKPYFNKILQVKPFILVYLIKYIKFDSFDIYRHYIIKILKVKRCIMVNLTKWFLLITVHISSDVLK